MADDDRKLRLTRSQVFIVIFFGIALLLSISTILGTWEAQREGVVDPAAQARPAAAPGK